MVMLLFCQFLYITVGLGILTALFTQCSTLTVEPTENYSTFGPIAQKMCLAGFFNKKDDHDFKIVSREPCLFTC